MSGSVNKVDSNVTGLRFAEETAIKVLPATPTWHALEPNSYEDFGGEITTVARNPINPSRQRKKGTVTGLEASGGFNNDFTQTGLTRLLQGFFFADQRIKGDTAPINGATPVTLTSVDSATKTIAAGGGLDIFGANRLVFLSGFAQAGNNGLKTVASSTATTLVMVEALVDEAAPPAAARVQVCGHQFAADEVAVDVSGSLPRITRGAAATPFDFTTLGLIPGEWVFVGGDATETQFASTADKGFARVYSVSETEIVFDKTDAAWAADAGTDKTIRLFFGNVLKNESAANLIKRRSFQLERSLGQDGSGTMSEYLVGAIPSELTMNSPQADKVNMDLSFVAVDNEQRDGTVGLKGGNRPTLGTLDAFNTSSDFSRLRMALVSTSNAAPAPLFAYLTELSLTVNNNVSPNGAVGILGAFDVTAGTFEVGGEVTAYFNGIAPVQAVRNNSDVTIDWALMKNNAGWVFDIPLLALGDGRLNVEPDQPITLPLSMAAAESSFGHTLLMNEFPYLPNLADS